jgi:hypothetical protein
LERTSWIETFVVIVKNNKAFEKLWQNSILRT